MVIKKIFFIIFVIISLFSYNLNASRILDFETESFIKLLIEEIKKINNLDKEIKFKIISNKNINAFVDQNKIIYINSGLIENCNDYVALLSVIAHEIGHINKNHIAQRKLKYNKLEQINKLSSLSIIAGSMISNNPEILQGLMLSSAGISDSHINFSKNQEREADYFSLTTLKKLNVYSKSIIELLKTIEEEYKMKGITKERMKKSTHPYFEERVDIINYLKNKEASFDENLNLNFKYIQAKFLGYSGNLKIINKLEDKYKKYALAILNAKNGNLKKSLKELNNLILLEENNYFLLETKADILYSYAYINESIKFYNKVINKYPDNYYAKIRVFENTPIDSLTNERILRLFFENLNLLKIFYNNKNILLMYLKISKKVEKNDWIEFLNYWINKKTNKEMVVEKLKVFKKTDDKDLLNLLEVIYNDIS